MSTENIEKFLQTAYSDEKLAALLAHAQDGKLGYYSCCCFIGVATANHALFSAGDGVLISDAHCGGHHLRAARDLPFGDAAEREFMVLGVDDAERCRNLLPLIIAEQERRTWERIADKLPDISLEEQHRLEEDAAQVEGELTEASGYPDPAYGRRL